MLRTVHLICEIIEFDDKVTVSEDALVRDLLIEAGVTDTMELLNCSPLYYHSTSHVYEEGADLLHEVVYNLFPWVRDNRDRLLSLVLAGESSQRRALATTVQVPLQP
jgi:hypothetical protein